MPKKKVCKNGVCKIGNKVVSVQVPPPAPNTTQRSVVSQQLSPLNQQPIQQPSLQQNLQQLQQPSLQGDQGDIQRRIVSTQLAPINNQSQQQPSFNLNVLPAQTQGQPQQSPLQQNLDALQGQSQGTQAQPVSDTAAQALIQKVENKIPLQPQEAMALRDYLQQYAPQQQYNPQGYLQGPLTGLFPTDEQQANIPYEQSPFFTYAQGIQNNPNAPA